MSNLLHCSQVAKSYFEGSVKTEVLKGVSFSLQARELVSIVGTSGSGKSTLLHVLGALDAPTSGTVEFLGQNLNALSANKQAKLRNKHLGFVYQFHHLLAEFSAQENVCMPLLIAGVQEAEANERSRLLLARVGLSERLDHRPAELSGGERQRVAIARALVNEPSCVLMDEPTGNLDRHTALEIHGLMAELSATLSTCFIVVTHDEALAASMDRTLRLCDGKLHDSAH